MKRSIALLLVLPLWPALAAAEPPGQYFGLSLGGYEARPPNSSQEFDVTDVSLRFGYHLNKYLGVEGRVGTNGRNITGRSGDSSVPDTEYAGVFLRLDAPFEKLNVYLLVGASEVQFDDESVDEENDAIAGGVGLELFGSERTALVLEYMTYSEDALSGFGLGIKHHFGWPSFR